MLDAEKTFTVFAEGYFEMSRHGQLRRNLLIGTACAAVLIALGAIYIQRNQRVENPKKIRIGAILPLTGDSAGWGEQGKWGVELAVMDANESIVIDGTEIEVVYEDSQAVPRIGIAAFNKLTQVDGVPAIVGDIVSSTTLAMAPYAEERKVVLIGISTSAPAITNAGRFVFRVWPSDNLEGSAAADWAYAQGHRKVSVLHMANDYGVGLAEAFQDRFGKHGGSVVSTQSYPQDQTDFRANLTRVKAEAPDVLYLIGYYKDVALALKQAKELGLSVVFMGPTAVESPELLKIAGDAAEGLVYPTIVDFDPAHPTDRQAEFIERFRARFGKEPDWAASHAYDAALVVFETLKSGARTGEQIRSAIDARRKFEGVTGKIQFDKNGDVIEKKIVIKTVRNGKFDVLQVAK